MFNQTITIVNKWFNKTTKANEYKLHTTTGFWSSNQGINISGTDLVKSDGVGVDILLTPAITDGYVSPKVFQTSGTGWTLQKDDYIVKGSVASITDISALKDNYEAMKIVNVAIKDYGSSDMQHIEVSGN